jgi:hypothetical protein
MSSRLATDQAGRIVCVVATPSLSLLTGQRFVVVDLFDLGFIRPGRAPTAQERLSARPPYDSNSAKRRRERPEVPDELLADEEAIRQAMIEQRRTPPDLVNVAA